VLLRTVVHSLSVEAFQRAETLCGKSPQRRNRHPRPHDHSSSHPSFSRSFLVLQGNRITVIAAMEPDVSLDNTLRQRARWSPMARDLLRVHMWSFWHMSQLRRRRTRMSQDCCWQSEVTTALRHANRTMQGMLTESLHGVWNDRSSDFHQSLRRKRGTRSVAGNRTRAQHGFLSRGLPDAAHGDGCRSRVLRRRLVAVPNTGSENATCSTAKVEKKQKTVHTHQTMSKYHSCVSKFRDAVVVGELRTII